MHQVELNRDFFLLSNLENSLENCSSFFSIIVLIRGGSRIFSRGVTKKFSNLNLVYIGAFR